MRKLNISIKLDTRRALNNGKYPIRIRIGENGEAVYISTQQSCSKENFTGVAPQYVLAREPLSGIINNNIGVLFGRISEDYLKRNLSGELDNLSLKEIKDALVGEKASKTKIRHDIKGYAEYYISNVLKKEGTKEIYRTMLQRIEWACDTEKKQLKDIDYKFLSNLENTMIEKGLSINTRAITMRCLRAIINRAINEDILPLNSYPFRKFKIKEVVKAKNFPPIEIIRKLYKLQLVGRKKVARDMFFLSFFLCGANPIDIFSKKKDADYERGVFSFVRTKIERFEPDAVKITINEQLRELIREYKGKEYVFNFAEKNRDYKTWLNNLRKELRRIGKSIDWETLKFYDARYCWSTFASSLGTADYIIDKALGHTINGSLAMSRYVAFDYALVDRANDKVRDYLILPDSNLPSEVASI